MNPIAAAVLRTGLLSPQVVDELRRWGTPLDDVSNIQGQSPDQVAAKIRETLESEHYVLVRETDLAVLGQYLTTATTGTLHLVLDDDATLEDTDVPVTFGKTPLDEYIFAWMSSSIVDVLTNALTYLETGATRVYFGQVRELFFGETKAFMICTPQHFEALTKKERS